MYAKIKSSWYNYFISNSWFLEEEINLNKSSFINKLHEKYLKRVSFYRVPEEELTRFSWSEGKTVNIYAIKVSSDNDLYHVCTLYFAVKNSDKTNKLIQLDLVSSTSNPEFLKISDGCPDDKLSWLHNHNLLNKVTDPDIIKGSIHFGYEEIEDEDQWKYLIINWSKNWADSEYYATQSAEEKPTLIHSFPKTNQKFFIDRCHFDDMLKALHDSQFTDEFNQCLCAYENEQWFLCATGLGSCMEHLMLIILKNYDKREKGDSLLKGLPKNPTAKDYLKAFKKDPIKIEEREEKRIESLFLLRNSVDHHNTGITQKNSCDLLLTGIADIYNDYYPRSLSWKPDKS